VNALFAFPMETKLNFIVYTHPVAKAIEYMVVDALLAADAYLNIS